MYFGSLNYLFYGIGIQSSEESVRKHGILGWCFSEFLSIFTLVRRSLDDDDDDDGAYDRLF